MHGMPAAMSSHAVGSEPRMLSYASIWCDTLCGVSKFAWFAYVLILAPSILVLY